MPPFALRITVFLLSIATLVATVANGVTKGPDGSWEQPFAFLCFFVSLWMLITGSLGIASGSLLLARNFSASSRPNGTKLMGQVSRVGDVPERNVTGLVISDAGLYVWALWPFALFRPALLIPWAAIAGVHEQSMFFGKCYSIAVGKRFRIVVSRTAYEAIVPFLPNNRNVA